MANKVEEDMENETEAGFGVCGGGGFGLYMSYCQDWAYQGEHC